MTKVFSEKERKLLKSGKYANSSLEEIHQDFPHYKKHQLSGFLYRNEIQYKKSPNILLGKEYDSKLKALFKKDEIYPRQELMRILNITDSGAFTYKLRLLYNTGQIDKIQIDKNMCYGNPRTIQQFRKVTNNFLLRSENKGIKYISWKRI